MRKIIIQLPDNHDKENHELMDIRKHFGRRIADLGGLNQCRENTELIQEMEAVQEQYYAEHENIVDRCFYHSTVNWEIYTYNEKTCRIQAIKMTDGSEKARIVSIVCDENANDDVKFIKDTVEKTYALTQSNLNWKPLHPNNMSCNGLDGYYCVVLHTNKDGKISGRKYTIVFQHKEREPGTGYVNKNEIDRYVLFEKSYSEIHGSLEHPSPLTDSFALFYSDTTDTLNSYDINDYGSFVYAYETLDLAKQRALVQYKAIYGYAMSHLML